MNKLTSIQIENIQIDYGIIYINYGETSERKLGPTKGGATLNIERELRDIQYDGAIGKMKGLQVVEEIKAVLAVNNLECGQENLALAMPWASFASDVITGASGDVGVVQSADYLTNVTMFAKLIGGDYKKITLYNAMNESNFSLAATPKAEGTVALEIHAHWDPTDDTANLFKIEEVSTIS